MKQVYFFYTLKNGEIKLLSRKMEEKPVLMFSEEKISLLDAFGADDECREIKDIKIKVVDDGRI